MPRRVVEDLVLAFGFLTRLPMPMIEVRDGRKLSEAFWAFPLAGLVVGGLAGVVLWSCLLLGLGKSTSAVVAMAVLATLTGAMHEDGLADFWDGLGGGRTLERKLEIMRDSRIGTYGVLALLLCYMMILALLAELSDLLVSWQPRHGIDVMPGSYVIIFPAFAAMLSRAMIALPAFALPAARDDGLAAFFGRPGVVGMSVSVLWPVALAVLILQQDAVPLILGSFSGAAIATALAWRYLGGVTGDVFGASIMMSFVVGLALSVVWLS